MARTRSTALERRAFSDLRYMDDEDLEFIAKNKVELSTLTFDEAVVKGLVAEKSPREFFSWIRIQQMAKAFDMFMALADD